MPEAKTANKNEAANTAAFQVAASFGAAFLARRVWILRGLGMFVAGAFALSLLGSSLDSSPKITHFSRHMQIRYWTPWNRSAVKGPVYDRSVFEDTIFFDRANRAYILKDHSVVRGKIFIDYILGGVFQINNKEEYEYWSNRSRIDYQININPDYSNSYPILRRRFHYENTYPRGEHGTPIQAGLRVPLDAAFVEADLDFSLLADSSYPTHVECRIDISDHGGGFQEISRVAEVFESNKALFYCAEKNLPAGSMMIFQWLWPELPKN
jgi:hypothetical protein